MTQYTDELVRKAKNCAFIAHEGQLYGTFPYHKHLEDVIRILKRFDFNNKYLIAGYLHDTIEDTALSYDFIAENFGKCIADIVYAVTDELGKNRKERRAKTYPKIAANEDAIIIKLADRIANVEQGGKIEMYAKEHAEFKWWFYREDRMMRPMWDYLENVINKWKIDQTENRAI